ncbi:hypothetical protein QJS10_CPA09g00912 [Acorus calamus]|uniref:Uncharacterized protein n=1 Tax=Acorus calamus TaxID=4465 RepID=A0AAV9E607_ACOCL|nr:hypothetical protein QJS10_CPA09g00912 [Acorus calamus]
MDSSRSSKTLSSHQAFSHPKRDATPSVKSHKDKSGRAPCPRVATANPSTSGQVPDAYSSHRPQSP